MGTEPSSFVSQLILSPFLGHVMSPSTAVNRLLLDRNIADTSQIGKLTMSFHKRSLFGMTIRLHVQLSRDPPELNAHPSLRPHFHLPEKTFPKIPVPDWFTSACGPIELGPFMRVSCDTVDHVVRVRCNDQTTEAIRSPVSIPQGGNNGTDLRAVDCHWVLLASGPLVLQRKACEARCRLVVNEGTTRPGVWSAVVHACAVCIDEELVLDGSVVVI